MYETIQSPINYGGLPLKNRIIFAPTSLGLPQPEQIERLRNIAAGSCAMRIDCAAMSRQLTADPQWPNKVATGRAKEIHRCVRCNQKCLGGMMAHQGVHCIYDKKEEAQS